MILYILFVMLFFTSLDIISIFLFPWFIVQYAWNTFILIIFRLMHIILILTFFILHVYVFGLSKLFFVLLFVSVLNMIFIILNVINY